jgi:CRP-like cAMP-binding protein
MVFSQADLAQAIFYVYVRKGKIKLTVVSKEGKEAVVAILRAGHFFGEGYLAGQSVRMATTASVQKCSLRRILRGLSCNSNRGRT